MTLVKDDMDAWLATALEYIRDQLRQNSTVGIGKALGMRTIEIGDFTLTDLARHPEASPSIWITPRSDTTQRYGNALGHGVRVEIRVFGTGPLGPLSQFVDAQAEHRKVVGKVWNEVLHLRDSGITAGAWHDWTPDGPTEWGGANAGDNALWAGVLRFRFDYDKVWISEGA